MCQSIKRVPGVLGPFLGGRCSLTRAQSKVIIWPLRMCTTVILVGQATFLVPMHFLEKLLRVDSLLSSNGIWTCYHQDSRTGFLPLESSHHSLIVWKPMLRQTITASRLCFVIAMTQSLTTQNLMTATLMTQSLTTLQTSTWTTLASMSPTHLQPPTRLNHSRASFDRFEEKEKTLIRLRGHETRPSN